jgi:hypothetical protein
MASVRRPGEPLGRSASDRAVGVNLLHRERLGGLRVERW